MGDGSNGRATGGQVILSLGDGGLSSTRTAVETISHELNHVRGYSGLGEFASEGSAVAAALAAGRHVP